MLNYGLIESGIQLGKKYQTRKLKKVPKDFWVITIFHCSWTAFSPKMFQYPLPHLPPLIYYWCLLKALLKLSPFSVKIVSIYFFLSSGRHQSNHLNGCHVTSINFSFNSLFVKPILTYIFVYTHDLQVLYFQTNELLQIWWFHKVYNDNQNLYQW